MNDKVQKGWNILEDLCGILGSIILGEATYKVQLGLWAGRYGLSIPDKLFCRKLKRFADENRMSDEEKKKFCDRFSKEGSREENILRLLNIINVLETEEKVDYINNLRVAYGYGRITHTNFFRICNIVANTLYEDLIFLKTHIKDEKSFSYSDEIQGLLNYGLVEQSTINMGSFEDDGENHSEYSFTRLAEMVDKFALSYDDIERYPQFLIGATNG